MNKKLYLMSMLTMICINFCSGQSSEFVTNKNNEEVSGFAKILYLISYDFKLMNAYENYIAKHQAEIIIRCKTCQKNTMTSAYIGSYLLAAALKDIVDSDNNYAEMKNYMEELLRLLSEGTESELSEFLLQMSSYLEITCTYCEGLLWEIV